MQLPAEQTSLEPRPRRRARDGPQAVREPEHPPPRGRRQPIRERARPRSATRGCHIHGRSSTIQTSCRLCLWGSREHMLRVAHRSSVRRDAAVHAASSASELMKGAASCANASQRPHQSVQGMLADITSRFGPPALVTAAQAGLRQRMLGEKAPVRPLQGHTGSRGSRSCLPLECRARRTAPQLHREARVHTAVWPAEPPGTRRILGPRPESERGALLPVRSDQERT